MRPEEASRQINNVLWNRFLVQRRLKDLTLEQIQTELIGIKPALIQLYNKSLPVDDDYRTGEETYGYKSTEDVKERLDYISDRWYCSFRLRWLLDLIEKDLSETNLHTN